MAQSETHGGVAQVGGTHYGTKYGHWDYCKDAQTPYLEGNATKYLMRWREKAGIVDLEKALSYVDKIMVGNEMTDCDRDTGQYNHLLERMFQENSVPDAERTIIYAIVNWHSYDDLLMARNVLAQFIQFEKERKQHYDEIASNANGSYTNQGR